MKPLLLLHGFLLLLLVLTTSYRISAAAASKLRFGGWMPIKDVTEPHVLELGEYAVSEHNKVAQAALMFIQVVSAERQVVSGVNYRLVIEAKDGEAVGDYVAVVWEKTWAAQFRKLDSFKPVMF